jgi:hypothetical protein
VCEVGGVDGYRGFGEGPSLCIGAFRLLSVGDHGELGRSQKCSMARRTGHWIDNRDLADLDHASIIFTHQIDRHGQRVPLKADAAYRPLRCELSVLGTDF